jgi:hypothetical protein
MHEAWKTVTVLTANAGAERHVLLIEHNPAWSMEGMITGSREIIAESLDARLV